MVALASVANNAQAMNSMEFFESRIRPLLIAKCYTCHTTSSSGGLRVDSRARLLRGGYSGPAIKIGDPDASLLIQAVSHTHESLRMPPEGSLKAHEVTDLKKWIRDGVNWPSNSNNFFVDSIHPLLEEHCLTCHQENPQGGLRLDSRAAMILGGHHGTAMIPGNPKESLLMRVLRFEHDRIRMPPTGKLSDQVIALFGRWIQEGAAWGEVASKELKPYEISDEQKSFWSFQPIVQSPVPSVTNENYSGNPVDRFIYASLTEKGLVPVTVADKRTLIRRAAYDLTGLPPSVRDVEEFLADETPSAYQKVIERLLASRHYGERWGRHWLDLVRYADTAGDSGDFPVPEAFKYRNYVISSFNNDKPYDQFVREQIAGDQLPFTDEEHRWEQLIGTGYIAISRRIGVTPETLGHIRIEDTLNNLGKTFLGLTIGCARCHNHKFDPISAADYYALYGIFDSSVYPFPGSEHKPHRENFVYRVGNQKATEILKPYQDELMIWNRKERTKFAEYQSFQDRKITDPTRTRLIVWNELGQVREERAAIAKKFPPLEIGYAVVDATNTQDARIHKAGDPKSLGARVRRRFPQVLGGQSLSDDATGSGRLELAGWLTDTRNPLTARVMVNRIWHYHFGRGIVETTSDFGVRGMPPTHPELLDYLATYFIDSGWSIKAMHRLIMGSQTYQISDSDVSVNMNIDPENKFLWRANRRRLDAESLRDTILLLSGNLDPSQGGRHPMPHHLTYFYRQHEPFNEFYESNRRTVYTMQQRFEKNAYLDLFDGPDGNIQLAERKSSITALQALFLMNSKFLHEQADTLAERVIATNETFEERLRYTYKLILSRVPNADEIRRAKKFMLNVQSNLNISEDTRAHLVQRAWASYLRAMFASNEFIYIN